MRLRGTSTADSGLLNSPSLLSTLSVREPINCLLCTSLLKIQLDEEKDRKIIWLVRPSLLKLPNCLPTKSNNILNLISVNFLSWPCSALAHALPVWNKK